MPLAIEERSSVLSPGPGRRMPAARDQAGGLAHAIRAEVIQPWFKVEWLPGARDALAYLSGAGNETPSWLLSQGNSELATFLKKFDSIYRSAFGSRDEPSADKTSSAAMNSTALEKLTGWAARTAAGESIEKPESGRRPALSPTLTAAGRASALLAQSASLTRWAELAPLLVRMDNAEATLIRVPRVARECGEIRLWLKEWQTAQVHFGPFLAGFGSPAHSLMEAAKQLEDWTDGLLDKLREKENSWPTANEMALRTGASRYGRSNAGWIWPQSPGLIGY